MAEEFSTEVDLPAPAEEVFRHLTEPAAMIRWMGQHATLTPVPGGAFEVDINGVPVRGRYLEVDPPRRVVVSWGVAGNTDIPPGGIGYRGAWSLNSASASHSVPIRWFSSARTSQSVHGVGASS